MKVEGRAEVEAKVPKAPSREEMLAKRRTIMDATSRRTLYVAPAGAR